ncbi:hypothetical protein KIN20_014868 [Parelaphostrongylus tenuis]|uniref:Uncharacterized protein n=1 Tax=Parelaphostrongylus tenuis TaxID=148309 RepID=A0AAD5MXT3_PARTN|nr:hypothetical protein KIN20_014868 [Parelaphostrongylus tenuis]
MVLSDSKKGNLVSRTCVDKPALNVELHRAFVICAEELRVSQRGRCQQLEEECSRVLPETNLQKICRRPIFPIAISRSQSINVTKCYRKQICQSFNDPHVLSLKAKKSGYQKGWSQKLQSVITAIYSNDRKDVEISKMAQSMAQRHQASSHSVVVGRNHVQSPNQTWHVF